MALLTLDGLSLCSGGGGLELGVGLALAGRHRAVAYVERDPYAAATLVARMEDETLGLAPIWDDVLTFDALAFAGLVDIVTAGFPCQPFSAAGRKQGLDDERWLWPEVARVVREVGPALVFVENVRGFLAEHGGLGAVLGDLADLGFDAEWEVLSAADVGATHKRERFWLLAVRWDRVDDAVRRGLGGCEESLRAGWDAAVDAGGHALADDDDERCEGVRRQPGHDGIARRDTDRSSGAAVADAGCTRRPEVPGGAPGDEGAHGRQPHADHLTDGADKDLADAHRSTPIAEVTEWRARERADARRSGESCPLFPPGPDELDRWRDVLGRDPSVEPSLHGVADGMAYRVDRSHLIGNGVVPLVAAAAFVRLAVRAGLIDLRGAAA